jgi:large subunit ribosomal protein L22
MIAHLRRVRISPKKANLVAGMVRNMPVQDALAILKHTPKKGAKILYKVIASASANAENNFKQNAESLVVQEIVVTQGPTFKRWNPVSRGRAHPILKRTSHITVKVESDPRLLMADAPQPKKEAKKEEKAEATPKKETAKKEKKATSKKSND